MFISVTFRILSFRTLRYIPQKKISIEISANYQLTTFRIPQNTTSLLKVRADNINLPTLFQ